MDEISKELRITKLSGLYDIRNVMRMFRQYLKMINFEKHTNENHFTWNYVDFIIYLNVNNPKMFSAIEFYVLEKINNNDITWLPHD